MLEPHVVSVLTALGSEKRGNNVTLVGAMALRGIVAAMSFEAATDRLAFETYIEQVLVPNLWTGAVVVMDNLPAPKAQSIEAAITQAGAKLVDLSPYSPDFSLIEHCWSKVKEFLRAVAARSRNHLDPAISAALAAVRVQDLQGWFQNCGYCIASI